MMKTFAESTDWCLEATAFGKYCVCVGGGITCMEDYVKCFRVTSL